MKKNRRPSYTKGIKRYAVYFLLSMAALEALALYFPILLQRVTITAEQQFMAESTDIAPLVWQSLLVLGFIVVIFAVFFLTEWLGAVYTNKYSANIRAALYQKFSKLSGEQIDRIGVAKILPTIMNDTNWLRTYHRRKISMLVFFPVAIVGSIIFLFTLSWIYAVFALATIPFVGLFYFLNIKRMGRFVPPSVESYDEMYLNMKEGIRGARDIRILGKADERAQDFEGHVANNRRQALATTRGHAMSTGFHAILFTLVTVLIILFASTGQLTQGEYRTIVYLSTAIQYINRIWAGSHQIFVWFLDTIPRCKYTYKRLDAYYAMTEEKEPCGLNSLPVYKKNTVKLNNVSYKKQLSCVNIEIPEGKFVGIVGGIGSGKSILGSLLLQLDQPEDGLITFNEIDIAQINPSFWRRDFVSYCHNAQIIPGTIRDNLKILNPSLTDEQILDVFKELGAMRFVKQFDNFLDFEIKDGSLVPEGIKNVISLVRTVLKPASLYVFNQCFEHVRDSYIQKLIAKLKREKKTAVFMSLNVTVCKACQRLYVLKNGEVTGQGTHAGLMRSNPGYREFHASNIGTMVYEDDKIAQEVPTTTGEEDTVQTVNLTEETHVQVSAEAAGKL
ncbi:MAG: ABC transporter ATP-binding protein/permease [Firmicutes bacterium]|nr:ABC transporter ATP-binding protein/permease [Bacillota bacterium]